MDLPPHRQIWRYKRLQWSLLLIIGAYSSRSAALTANKVSFEFHPGFYRVVVSYTLPALKEYREAYADFTTKKKAEAFYWRVLRGADFYLGDPGQISFPSEPSKPQPW